MLRQIFRLIVIVCFSLRRSTGISITVTGMQTLRRLFFKLRRAITQLRRSAQDCSVAGTRESFRKENEFSKSGIQ